MTKAPIKYVIYSHSHFDHTAGGQPFKDLGAIFVAQRNAKARILALKPPDVVVPQFWKQYHGSNSRPEVRRMSGHGTSTSCLES